MSSYETEKQFQEGRDAIATETGKFFKKAFNDMKESAKAQHEVDKARFEAIKAESKANFEQAKAMGNANKRKEILQKEREKQLAEAKEMKDNALSRIDAAKGNK